MRGLLLSALLASVTGAAFFGGGAAPAAAEEIPEAPVSVDGGKRLLSKSLKDSLRRVHWEFAKTDAGRRLLALTDSVRIEERRVKRGLPVRWVRANPPYLLVDRDRARRLSLLDFEILFYRARWLALADFPIDLHDSEWAARQAVLEYALEKASVNPEFEKKFRKATSRVRSNLVGRKQNRDYAREKGARAEALFPGKRPRRTLEALAFDLYLFSEDPHYLYESLRAETGDLPELDTIEDILTLHAARLGEVEFRAGGGVAVIQDRRYRGIDVKAAVFVEDRETLAELRERAGPYRGVGSAALAAAVNQWLRDTP
jgi:hypothetical protein